MENILIKDKKVLTAEQKLVVENAIAKGYKYIGNSKSYNKPIALIKDGFGTIEEVHVDGKNLLGESIFRALKVLVVESKDMTINVDDFVEWTTVKDEVEKKYKGKILNVDGKEANIVITSNNSYGKKVRKKVKDLQKLDESFVVIKESKITSSTDVKDFLDDFNYETFYNTLKAANSTEYSKKAGQKESLFPDKKIYDALLKKYIQQDSRFNREYTAMDSTDVNEVLEYINDRIVSRFLSDFKVKLEL